MRLILKYHIRKKELKKEGQMHGLDSNSSVCRYHLLTNVHINFFCMYKCTQYTVQRTPLETDDALSVFYYIIISAPVQAPEKAKPPAGPQPGSLVTAVTNAPPLLSAGAKKMRVCYLYKKTIRN